MHFMFAETWTEQAFSGTYTLIWLAWTVLVIIGGWKMYVKAGKPGWGIIIPFYNVYLLCKIAGRPGWWLILLFIPFVNIVIYAIISYDLARNFGHGGGYAVLIFFFPAIMYVVLGFGGDRYTSLQAA